MDDSQILFENNGTNWYRIPSLVTTPNGVLIATCDRRKGSMNDHGQEAEVVMRRSFDNGATWTETVVLARKEGATLHSAASLVDRQRGRVFKFYRVSPVMPNHRDLFNAERDDWEHWTAWGAGNYIISSDDDGATWSAPRRLTLSHPDAVNPERFGNSVHGVQLDNGTLIVQACCSCARDFAYNSDRPARAFLLISDDHGQTWTTGASWPVSYGQMEYCIAALSDGRLYINQRSLGPHRLAMWLDDCRQTQAELRPEPQLPEPVCHAGLEMVGDVHYFANPDVENNEGAFRAETRHDLTLRRSRDGGATWETVCCLKEGPAAYVDLAALPDGTLACLYECGDERYNDRIEFTRLDVSCP